MGYVAVRGGQQAIEASLDLLAWERIASGVTVDTEQIIAAFPELVDQVMGESSLYAPELAALAIKQAQGSPEEAVFLMRAFRSTLERPYVSRTVEPKSMMVGRRISAAFKDVPGGQILGATRDYSHRLIDFDLQDEDAESVRKARKKMKRARKFEYADMQTEVVFSQDSPQGAGEAPRPAGKAPLAWMFEGDVYSEAERLPKIAEYLRSEGLLVHYENDDGAPSDVTMEPLTFPATRSARLQTLTRGMTQAVTALGYAAIRGFGPSHPTVAELRFGRLELAVDHPLAEEGASQEEAYYLGALPVTEVESLFEIETASPEGGQQLSFDLGYAMVIGHNETKAIAMSVLDHCLMMGDARYPTQDEEFVLYHVDGVEASGFISHLKLPHYVTFQSKLSSVRKTRESGETTTAQEGQTHAAAV